MDDPTAKQTPNPDETMMDIQSPRDSLSTETHTDGDQLSDSPLPCSTSLDYESQTSQCSRSQMNTISGNETDRGMIFLPSCPSKEDWFKLVATINGGFGLTGSAVRGNVGPVVGMTDIGESEQAYLFRVSLPGVRTDSDDFGWNIEADGTVNIKGVTVTGESSVLKDSQVFEMQSQNLCPPGPFSISFKLPGPVDPPKFYRSFAADGIFEGTVFKAKKG